LRQRFTTVGSVRCDSPRVVKVNRRKTNHRKTRPQCTFKIQFVQKYDNFRSTRFTDLAVVHSWYTLTHHPSHPISIDKTTEDDRNAITPPPGTVPRMIVGTPSRHCR
jgi:hypothetical protein